MIAERAVLFRIENLKQSRTRVTTIIASKFVDLIEQDDRINRPRTLHQLHDLPRHRADVCAAMPANLGFVMNAAKCETNEFASRRISYRFP